MNKRETLIYACRIMALVQQSVNDYENPADGFCPLCPFSESPGFRNDGQALDFMRDAVLEKLAREKIEVDPKMFVEVTTMRGTEYK